MELNGHLILSYIEEDNIQKAFFRVRPLLCTNGVITAEDCQAWPDNGFMRVVPDKNEQHTFKERMRGLCPLCLIDLKNVKPDYSKVRNNKNYSPERGEFNQFIIYSDAVKKLPEGLFFDIVPENAVESGATAVVFTRNGGNIQGPYRRDNGEQAAEELIRIRPDSSDIYAVTRPDGKEHLIYWPAAPVMLEPVKPSVKEEQHGETAAQTPAAEEKPVIDAPGAQTPVEKSETVPEAAGVSAAEGIENTENTETAYEKIRSMDAGLKVSSNLLHSSGEHSEIPAAVNQFAERKQLSGTPLYRPGFKTPAQPHGRNYLNETVERQRVAGRYESAGAEIADAGKLKEVENPVERFNAAFRAVWRISDTREQVVQSMICADGIRTMLSKALGTTAENLPKAAFKAQLQEMEAERLMQLMHLEEMKSSRETLIREALENIGNENKKTSERLKEEQTRLNSESEKLLLQEKELCRKRDELKAEISAFSSVSVLAAPQGNAYAISDTAKRIQSNLNKCGFVTDANLALAMLIAKTVSRDIAIVCETEDDARLAAVAFCKALGAAYTEFYPDIVAAGGNGYKLLITDYLSEYPYGQIVVSACEEAAGKGLCGIPEFVLRQNRSMIPDEPDTCPSCDQNAVLREINEASRALSEEERNTIIRIREVLPETLPARCVIGMGAFVKSASYLLSGGAASALDIGTGIYLVPAACRIAEKDDILKAIPENMIFAREQMK